MNLPSLLLRTRPYVPDDLQRLIDEALAKPQRAKRLPEDWKASPYLLDWASRERPDVCVSREVEQFKDYWLSKSGANACKVDWDRTFKVWMRNARASQKPEPKVSPVKVAEIKRREPAAVNPNVLHMLDEFAAKMHINR